MRDLGYMHLPEDIILLIEKYLKGTISAEERLLLDQWYNSLPEDESLLLPGSEDEHEMNEKLQRRIFTTILHYRHPVRRTFLWRWRLSLIAATVILILISFASYYFFRSDRLPEAALVRKRSLPAPAAAIVPGGNRALLTLGDGSTITLDSASNGMLGQQGNVKVLKLDNGLLSYSSGQDTKKGANNETVFNTISTPRGGQYQVTLSDGTKVWLNAASSISFPVAFAATGRTVTVTGEVYFEVAHDKTSPFKVQVSNSEIEVLGTHFNVNAYDDEAAMYTTLLEGSIRFRPRGSNVAPTMLSPGQQVCTDRSGNITVKKNADTEASVAWMHGNFQYKSADLHSILRQVARWYDVEIEYSNEVNLHFTGQLPRSENVLSLLEKLALTGEMHYKIEGRKVIISS